MPELDLDARLDALFATEPKDFTAARDALARALKADARADDAASVKGLRRPTVAAAAVNRVARAHADRVAALIAIGDELVALQGTRKPDRDALHDLTRQRRALVHQLTELAATTTERPESARTSIAATLDTASLDPQLRDALQRGRLTQELAPATRFVADDGAPAPRATSRRSPRARASPPRDELAARRARAELAAVRQRVDAANEQASFAAGATAEADEALEAARRHITELEHGLAQARDALALAKRAARQAERAELRAHSEQERVAKALQAAERAARDDRR